MLSLLLFGALALGAGPFLAHALNAPVRMASLGGVMSGDPAILHFRHLDHLYGTKDPVATTLPQTIFPGRWPLNRRSPWWEARRRGICRERAIGPITHMGKGGYYDGGTRLPDGPDHCTHSADEVVASICSWEGGGETAALRILRSAPSTCGRRLRCFCR